MCWNTFKKLPQTKKNEIIISLLFFVGMMIFAFFTALVLKYFPIIIAYLVQVGYKKIFAGSFDFSAFFVAIIMTLLMFFYLSTLLFLIIFLLTEKSYRGKWNNVVKKKSREIFKTNKNLFFLTFTVTVVLVLAYSGAGFLGTAFPDDPLFTKGATGVHGSLLMCAGDYPSLIAEYDISCTSFFSETFKNKEVDSAKIVYIKNGTSIEKGIYSFWELEGKYQFILRYTKEEQPVQLRIIFEDFSEEQFHLVHGLVYTKEEYSQREQDKAVWFFGVLSLSIFSVFSAMSNLKNIIRKNGKS